MEIGLVLILSFGLAGGVVGKIKGSSFFIWFLISASVPVIGLMAAVAYRVEDDEPRRRCPNCGRVTTAYDALCTSCGQEFEYPEPHELLPPRRAVAAR